jgi:hypothetical protein
MRTTESDTNLSFNTAQRLPLAADMPDRKIPIDVDNGHVTVFAMYPSVHFSAQNVTSICYTLVAPG